MTNSRLACPCWRSRTAWCSACATRQGPSASSSRTSTTSRSSAPRWFCRLDPRETPHLHAPLPRAQRVLRRSSHSPRREVRRPPLAGPARAPGTRFRLLRRDHPGLRPRGALRASLHARAVRPDPGAAQRACPCLVASPARCRAARDGRAYRAGETTFTDENGVATLSNFSIVAGVPGSWTLNATAYRYARSMPRLRTAPCPRAVPYPHQRSNNAPSPARAV